MSKHKTTSIIKLRMSRIPRFNHLWLKDNNYKFDADIELLDWRSRQSKNWKEARFIQQNLRFFRSDMQDSLYSVLRYAERNDPKLATKIVRLVKEPVFEDID